MFIVFSNPVHGSEATGEKAEFNYFPIFFSDIQFSRYKPQGGFYLEGRFNGRFFALPVWRLIFGGACFGNIKLSQKREVSVKDTEGVPDEKQNVACCRLRD